MTTDDMNSKISKEKQKAVRMIGFSFLIGLLLIVIILKFMSDTFSWKLFYIITGIVVVLSIFLIFGNKLYELIWHNSTKEPEEKSLLKQVEIEKIRDNALLNSTYFNTIRENISNKQYVAGEGSDKCIVYLYEVKPLYYNVGKAKCNFKIIINGHDRNKLPVVITEPVADVELKRNITAVGGAKEKDYEVNSVKTYNPILQNYSESTNKVPVVKKKKEDKSRMESLQ
jgi:hypothetical protein